MLDQIVNLVKDQAVNQFTNNSDVPNEQAEVAATAAGESIFETITEQLSGGNMDAVSGLLTGASGADSSNPLVQGVISNLTSKLTGSGVDAGAAQSAASGIIPGLMQSVVGKFMSPAQEDSGFDVQSLMNQVAGNAIKDQVTKGIGDALGGMFK